MTPAGAGEDQGHGEAGCRAGPHPSAGPSMHRKRRAALESEPRRGPGPADPHEEPSEDSILLEDVHREPPDAGERAELVGFDDLPVVQGEGLPLQGAGFHTLGRWMMSSSPVV